MIGVDVGGTFTDIVSIQDGEIVTAKVATNVAAPELAVIEGAQQVAVTEASAFNHASTHGLNAVLTRNLPKSASSPRRGTGTSSISDELGVPRTD